jgi:predicted dehydrogenase
MSFFSFLKLNQNAYFHQIEHSSEQSAMTNNNSGISRRHFLGTTALAASAITILPSKVIAGFGYKAPSDKLNIAGIGVGGMGFNNLSNMDTENIVTLCDVDWKYAGRNSFRKWPLAPKYQDYRQMFSKQKDIDAVMIATPDHSHALPALMAMKLGYHVYLQKPLTHSVYESRILTETAKRYGVATQMGNQGNSGEGIRQVCEWIWAGAIGEVTTVDAWTNRPIWPQGLERPKEKMKVPATLNWDLFIGPAKFRPYHEVYTPWNWRGWWDFGTGALGDMACHILDPVFKALMLQHPTAVEASSTQINTESAPNAERVTYWFPRRDNLAKVAMPEVKINWYDGGFLPERPVELKDGEPMGDWNGGAIFYGSKGKIMCGCYGANPTLLPTSEMAHFEQPEKIIRRISNADAGGHEQDWIRAAKENKENRVEAGSHFGYAGPFNEMVVMGVLAVRLQDLQKRLLWDGKNMQFTNIGPTEEIRVVTSNKFEVVNGDPKFDTKYDKINAQNAAEEWIRHNYRDGWEQI